MQTLTLSFASPFSTVRLPPGIAPHVAIQRSRPHRCMGRIFRTGSSSPSGCSSPPPLLAVAPKVPAPSASPHPARSSSAARRAKNPSTVARCGPARGGSAPEASAAASAAEATPWGDMSPANGGGERPRWADQRGLHSMHAAPKDNPNAREQPHPSTAARPTVVPGQAGAGVLQERAQRALQLGIDVQLPGACTLGTLRAADQGLGQARGTEGIQELQGAGACPRAPHPRPARPPCARGPALPGRRRGRCPSSAAQPVKRWTAWGAGSRPPGGGWGGTEEGGGRLVRRQCIDFFCMGLHTPYLHGHLHASR